MRTSADVSYGVAAADLDLCLSCNSSVDITAWSGTTPMSFIISCWYWRGASMWQCHIHCISSGAWHRGPDICDFCTAGRNNVSYLLPQISHTQSMCTLYNIILRRYAPDCDTDNTKGELSYLAENGEILIFKIHLTKTEINTFIGILLSQFRNISHISEIRKSNVLNWIWAFWASLLHEIQLIISENLLAPLQKAFQSLSDQTRQNLIISYPEFCFCHQHNSEVYRRRT